MAIPTAIIGFGMAARVFHAPLIRAAEGLRLEAVSTSRPEGVPAGVPVRSVGDILADSDFEVVVVATPNDTHFDVADAALRAGKHVVVDKPFTVTAHQAEQLIARSAEMGRLLVPFHNRRWDSDFLTVRGLFASGELGRIGLFEAHWDRFRPEVSRRWREAGVPGSGLLYDLGPHLVDQALLLFGRPDAVGGDIESQRDGAVVDDFFQLTLQYGSMRAKLSASNLVTQPRPRFGIHGTGGSFVKYGLDPQEDQLKAGVDPTDSQFGEEDTASHGILATPAGQRPIRSARGEYLAFYRAVAAAVRGDAPPPVAPDDALAGIRIIELARQSAAEGRRLRYPGGG